MEEPIDGSCVSEKLLITGQNMNSITPIICGSNSGQHSKCFWQSLQILGCNMSLRFLKYIRTVLASIPKLVSDGRDFTSYLYSAQLDWVHFVYLRSLILSAQASSLQIIIPIHDSSFIKFFYSSELSRFKKIVVQIWGGWIIFLKNTVLRLIF